MKRPVTVCGHALSSPRHICCFFDSREQQYEHLLPYFAEGVANGEEVLTVMDREHIEDHLARLADAGIPSGGMNILESEQAYLDQGRFDKDRMLAILERKLEHMQATGAVGLRTCGEMSWALRGLPGTEDLMLYESEVNRLLTRHDATFICTYDANRLKGREMLDLLSTHSHVVFGGTVRENPYYVQPTDFCRTLMARRAATSSIDQVTL